MGVRLLLTLRVGVPLPVEQEEGVIVFTKAEGDAVPLLDAQAVVVIEGE